MTRVTAILIIFAAPSVLLAQGENSHEPQWQLWKVNVDGTALAPLANTPGYSCGSPKWSPDGKFVAFDTRRVGQTLQESQIAVVGADGTGLRLMGGGGMPCWSPDGTHLVFHTYPTGYNTQTIDVMRADGTGRETLTNHWGSPRWMPRGNRIASTSINGGLAIFDLETGQEADAFSGPHSLRPGFAISPNCKQICFGENSGGTFLASFDGYRMRVTQRPLLPLVTFCHAAWSPDGSQIVFGTGDMSTRRPAGEPKYQLYLIDVDAQDGPHFLPGQDPKRNNTNPDWSPDGKTIIFASQDLPSP